MHGAPPSVIDQLSFLDLTSLVVFPALIALSIYYGNNLQLHARFIVCTVLLFMPPALTRALFFIPVMNSFRVNVNTSEAIVGIVLLVLIEGDRRRGRMWTPYPLALVTFTALTIASNYAGSWRWWYGLSRWMAGDSI